MKTKESAIVVREKLVSNRSKLAWWPFLTYGADWDTSNEDRIPLVAIPTDENVELRELWYSTSGFPTWI